MSSYDNLVRRVLAKISKQTAYYVYGGKALSVLLPSITSVDWDVVVQGSDAYIKEITKYFKEFTRGKSKVQVKVEKLKLIQLRTGDFTTIHQISIGNQEIMDVKFADAINLPVVAIDNINYLDISELYSNLNEAITTRNDVIAEWQDLTQRNPQQLIHRKVEERLTLIDELNEQIQELVGSDEEDEIPDLRKEIRGLEKEIRHLQSPDFLQEQYKELDQEMETAIQEYTKALQTNKKNQLRLYVLREAILKPSLFNPKYIHLLCEECSSFSKYSEGLPVRTVGSSSIYCNQLNC
jgi:hypothetical protein